MTKVLTEADAAADLAGLPRPVSSEEDALWLARKLDEVHRGHWHNTLEMKAATVLRTLVSERDALAGRVAELEAQNEAQKNEWLSWNEKRAALEANARRYEWLRDQADIDAGPAVADQRCNDWGKWYSVHIDGDDLDAAIDAAIRATKGGKL